MLKYTITGNSISGEIFSPSIETHSDFLLWASTKKHFGKRDWYLPASTDEDGNEILPDGRIDDTEYTVNVPESSYVDDEGNDQVSPAYSYIQYKMVDQWSYTVEDITEKLVRDDRQKLFKENASKHKRDIDFCKDLIGYIGYKNDLKNLTTVQRITLKGTDDLKSLLSDATAGFISSIKLTLTSMTPDGVLITNGEITEYLQLIDDHEKG